MAILKIYLLGAPRIERDNTKVNFDTRKATALVAYLAVTEQLHTRDALAAFLWPEYDHSRGRAALRRTLSTINKSLEGEHLEITRQSVELVQDQTVWVDSSEFLNLINKVGNHNHKQGLYCRDCVENLKAAVDLCQGDFMTGFSLRDSTNFDDWQFFQTDTLRQRLAICLENLVEHLTIEASYSEAILYGKQWLALDPLREEAHRWLMKCFEWSGQHNAALRQYRDCVRILNEELGVSPLEETETLYASIMKQQLMAPSTVIDKDSDQEVYFTQTFPQTDVTRSVYPLVGRSGQLAVLIRLYESKAKDGYFTLLTGEPGIGKTRLAEEFISNMTKRGVTTIAMRCFDGESDLAFSPLIGGIRAVLAEKGMLQKLETLDTSSLAEAARLFPELATAIPALPIPLGMEGFGARTHFYEGLSRFIYTLLTGSNPGILFLDDFQWADDASINLLAYIIHRLSGTPIFILVAYREGSFEQGLKLNEIRAASRRTKKFTEINLSRLTSEEVASLAHAVVGETSKLPNNLIERLYSETEGLPFFVVEYLNMLTQSFAGGVDNIDIIDEWRLPETIGELMSARLQAISQIANQIISAAAVIGRTFDFNTIFSTSGRSELETLNGLEELIKHGLIRESGNGNHSSKDTYDFSHSKLSAYVYEHTGFTRRRILHRRVAETLIENHREMAEASPMSSLIAQHYVNAGLASKAAEYFYRAGEVSSNLYAHHEALTHYRAAISAGHYDSAKIHERIGEELTLIGEYQEAIQSYEAAAALASQEHLPTLEVKLANIHHRMGEYELANCYFSNAMEELNSIETADEQSKAFQSRLLSDWSRSEHHLGHSDEAQSKAEQALMLAESQQDSEALAKAYNVMGILARSHQNFIVARQHLERSLTFSREITLREGEIAALNNLGLVSAEVGDIDEAIGYTGSALKICEKIGDRHRSAALYNHLADLYHNSGQPDRAMEHLKKAVKIFGEIDDKKSTPKPQIWMLIEW